jgi:autotransporter-associated beta strand protein
VGGSGVVDLHQGSGATVVNTFNLNGGTLSVSGITSANSAGTRMFNFNGGTLRATSANPSFMNLGAGNVAANVRNGGAFMDTAGFNVVMAQALQHSPIGGDSATDGGLTKLGYGTLTLNGANTYTGPTKVNAGTLELAQATLAPDSTVSIASSAVLQLDFATTNIVAGLILNGVSQPPGVYNSATAPSYISGSGTVLVPTATNPTNITFVASGTTLQLSWPADHLGWILQSESNLVPANWVDVPGSGSVLSTNLVINPAIPAEFFRLRHP